MANVISQVKLPDNTTYIIRDPNARPLNNNDFDTINVTELNAGDLIVTGVGRFTNGLYGDLIGNADTATTAAKLNGFKNTTSTGTAVNDATQNGHVYVTGTSDIYGISDGAAFVQAYSTSWVAQIYQDYRTGQIALRGKNNGTWQSWRKVWDSVNLTSKTAAASGTDLSLVTTGEKAVWNAKPSTDTKNTAGSTDTSSKIFLIGATSQTSSSQTYSQDTAYVGTDGCVYSGGNKVEVVSDNAGYHNSVYRGKSLGTSITEAQWASISAGTFEDMYIGDYWTLSTTLGSTTSNVQYVIAGFDYWWNCGDSYPQSSNKHHVVLVPASYLYSAQMNETNITTGGYIGSAMYTTNLANARTGISNLFGDHLYSVRRLFTNSVNASGQATGWTWVTSSVDLMNENMVYGSSVWTTSGFEVGVDRTILPLFALNPASASIRANWWLRSVATPAYFSLVSGNGRANCYNASSSYGVRPAFAIY